MFESISSWLAYLLGYGTEVKSCDVFTTKPVVISSDQASLQTLQGVFRGTVVDLRGPDQREKMLDYMARTLHNPKGPQMVIVTPPIAGSAAVWRRFLDRLNRMETWVLVDGVWGNRCVVDNCFQGQPII